MMSTTGMIVTVVAATSASKSEFRLRNRVAAERASLTSEAFDRFLSMRWICRSMRSRRCRISTISGLSVY
jgi:hypothetical protein